MSIKERNRKAERKIRRQEAAKAQEQDGPSNRVKMFLGTHTDSRGEVRTWTGNKKREEL